jgi:hypothetical protein
VADHDEHLEELARQCSNVTAFGRLNMTEMVTVPVSLKHARSRDDRPQAPTLSDLGVTKDQSSHWQKLAALPSLVLATG